MDDHETDDAWASEEVAVKEAPGGLELESSFGAAGTQRVPGTAVRQPEVLARLPDLDAVEASPAPDTRSSGRRNKALAADGRFLSQGLSTKLLIGGALLLVLAAIFPFVFNNHEPKPGTPPAPDAAEAPAWKGPSGETSEAPSGSANTSYEPKMSLHPDLPPPPDFIDTAPASSTDAPPQTPHADRKDRTGAAGHLRQSLSADRQLQADVPLPQARANRRMALSELPPAPDRWGQGLGNRGQGSGVRGQGTGVFDIQHPALSIQRSAAYPMVEPGVARLEGVIEKPSVRTSYDAARSSIH
jgi:hypothetical protein